VAIIIWLIIGVALAIAEVFTTTFLIVMFALGAFAAAGAAALGANILVQVLAFGAVSALSLWLLRPALQRHLNLGGGSEAAGIGEIEGSTATVVEEIDAEHGLVKIDGEMWRARSHDATQVIPVGEQVRVLHVKGATAIVWKD
jgi:membrane protein implicated in regulation of membrane protease activity